MIFPPRGLDGCPRLTLELDADGDLLPRILWAGVSTDGTAGPSGYPSTFRGPGMPLLGEHAHELFTRPHLVGHRTDAPGSDAAWSTRFTLDGVEESDSLLVVRAADPAAGLALTTEIEALPGGLLRGRHTLRSTGPGRYHLAALDVVLPAADDLAELLDFTGRHEGERTPQRHLVTDGLWLREGREGRPGLSGATTAILGTTGFGTRTGTVLGVHVAWSGNSSLRVERSPDLGTTLGGGELFQPGEIVLAEGEEYATPWVVFGASEEGLDGLAQAFHTYERSLPAHPAHQPVVLNVWEAVWFDHDLPRLREIADRAARVGIERFVLDDGWFHGRRDDTAGLGDWWIDPDVWPEGLTPLAEHVRALGMQFGLWFEPEMVNPDSDLHRAHPDWILATGDRVPQLHRHQLVLDLSRPEVWQHVHDHVHEVLLATPVDYVKWDHNRELLEAGSGARGGASVVRDQTLAFYRMLDSLRALHPAIDWESCASGGGRIDLGVLERTQRVWTSDMTDALARQHIQRWTAQLVAPEYLGAHVSSPVAHATGRTLPLDFRAATALFGAFGVEWDLSTASDDELSALAAWVDLHKRFRPLLHSGRVVRPESADAEVLLHGVVADDGSEALLAHVQLDESASNRGVTVRVPGLLPDAAYELRWAGPVDHRAVSRSVELPDNGPTGGVRVTGAALAARGCWIPRRRPETITLVHVTRAGEEQPR
ncbi:alpha-galactosidase [Nocardioides alpinus]|uniref:alpha-galactosidase n=1 Tax=Nocardioides alpinus TaxID=748909 RepID=A0A1I0VLR7_9ACTN|nr:alpha-galactosidase [Nocardioides alpinus]PKH37350.1 alpha-galactosidase [Nocardioides alpinus]SFA77364.1 alpha-galactosidase [Nocardioides alpinus]